MSQTEYVFHWEGGAQDFVDLRVVSFKLVEALSAFYEARIVLHARDKEIDPETLIGARATLRMATLTTPAVRTLHGLVCEAEERGETRAGMLYAVTLVPPFVRMAHRVRSRLFLEKSPREVIDAVLLGEATVQAAEGDTTLPEALDDSFVAPASRFVWRVTDTSRLDRNDVRPTCVQYNESDWSFVARLLEEEGLSYHFEHSASAVVLVISDQDTGKHRLDPFEALGPAIVGREITDLRLGRRLRATRVTLADYDWRKPALDLTSEAENGASALEVAAFPGRYENAAEDGAPLARVMLERLSTEARYATASASCRLLAAGTVFAVRHDQPRYEGEYLVVRAETSGESHGELEAAAMPSSPQPFASRVELVRRGNADAADESGFRPARRTPKPRILGSQTAVVTAAPGHENAEIHVGGPEGAEIGCVRLKFHWDAEAARHTKEPTSAWVRVSQMFAGAGGGAVAHPRVGTEVIVEYLDGDPDRPIVVGRVYNGAQLPPALAKGAATVTTLKSMSSPGAGTFNELSFDDTAGEEKVSLHAGKDWNSTVGNNRVETVKNDSSSDVKVNRNEETGVDRKTHVGGKNEETVDGNETVRIGGRQNLTITSGQDMLVTSDRNLTITGPHTAVVGPESYTVNGPQTVTVAAAKTESIGAALDLNVGAAATVNAGASFTVNAPSDTVNAPLATINSVSTTINASAACVIHTALLNAVVGGPASIQGAMVSVTAAGEILLSAGGGSIKIGGGGVEITGGTVKVSGGSVDIAGGVVKVN